MNDETLKVYLKISQHRMTDQYLPKLIRCLEVLNEEQIWKRDRPHLNSMGGLALHICEHIKRNMKSIEAGNSTTTSRIENQQPQKGIESFFPDENLTSNELVELVTYTFESWFFRVKCFLNQANINSEKVDIHKMYHLTEHVSYHLGQIVDRAQHITGKSFQFSQNGINEKNLRMKIEQELKRNKLG